MARVALGFIGLGAMGGRVTKRLLDDGYEVVGFNRTPTKAQWLLAAGMRWANTPREVAESVDVIFTMVTNTDALETVVQGPNGVLAGLRPGQVAGTGGPGGGAWRAHARYACVGQPDYPGAGPIFDDGWRRPRDIRARQ